MLKAERNSQFLTNINSVRPYLIRLFKVKKSDQIFDRIFYLNRNTQILLKKFRCVRVFNLRHQIRKLKNTGFSNTLVQLISYQNQNAVEKDPYHEDDQTSDRTIEKVVG